MCSSMHHGIGIGASTAEGGIPRLLSTSFPRFFEVICQCHVNISHTSQQISTITDTQATVTGMKVTSMTVTSMTVTSVFGCRAYCTTFNKKATEKLDEIHAGGGTRDGFRKWLSKVNRRVIASVF